LTTEGTENMERRLMQVVPGGVAAAGDAGGGGWVGALGAGE